MTGNQALNVNAGIGGTASIAITRHGSDWYWTVCAIMTLSTLAFLGLSFRRARTERLFHYITAGITFVSAIAYFTMASGLGQTQIQVEFFRQGNGTREIFYVRHIDWFITTPLILLDLFLTAGVPWPSALAVILFDEIMVVNFLVGALIPTTYKWGFFTFGLVSFFLVAWNIIFVARNHARALGPTISRTFNMCALLTVFIWFLYPIAWGLSEGGNVIHPDSEGVFYGVLDIFAKPVFGILFLFGHRNIVASDLGLHMYDYGEVRGARSEKATNGTNNGVTSTV